MSDMSKVIEPKSDQINAEDFLSGPQTIKITDVKVKIGTEQPVSVFFEGSKKVYRPCKSMSKIMVKVWGDDHLNYIGKSLTLYLDPKVKWGGVQVGGIRISHMSGLGEPLTFALSESKTVRKPYTVKPLTGVTPKAPVTPPQAAPPGITETEAMQHATTAASKGADGFRAWWNTEQGIACRELVKPKMTELKAIAAKADMPPPTPDDDDMPM